MGLEIAALTGFLGLTGAFALVGTALAAWMAWRIVEKAGLPGWAGLGAILLTLTGIGTVVPMVLLWVFAFMRWPRDEPATAATIASPAVAARHAPQPNASLTPPASVLADRRPWRLTGTAAGNAVALSVDGASSSYLLTGASAAQPADLSVPDPSSCAAAERRWPAWPRGPGCPERHLHRRSPAPAGARSTRHNGRAHHPAGQRRARPVARLKGA
jgi:hypothetical protein